LTEKL